MKIPKILDIFVLLFVFLPFWRFWTFWPVDKMFWKRRRAVRTVFLSGDSVVFHIGSEKNYAPYFRYLEHFYLQSRKKIMRKNITPDFWKWARKCPYEKLWSWRNCQFGFKRNRFLKYKYTLSLIYRISDVLGMCFVCFPSIGNFLRSSLKPVQVQISWAILKVSFFWKSNSEVAKLKASLYNLERWFLFRFEGCKFMFGMTFCFESYSLGEKLCIHCWIKF